ncbi:hypothetical protein ACS0TY_036858 [Phlomoides rotata]
MVSPHLSFAPTPDSFHNFPIQIPFSSSLSKSIETQGFAPPPSPGPPSHPAADALSSSDAQPTAVAASLHLSYSDRPPQPDAPPPATAPRLQPTHLKTKQSAATDDEDATTYGLLESKAGSGGWSGWRRRGKRRLERKASSRAERRPTMAPEEESRRRSGGVWVVSWGGTWCGGRVRFSWDGMSTTQDAFAEQAVNEDTDESVGSNHEGQEGRCPCHSKQAQVVCKVYLMERDMPSRNAYWCKDRLSRDFWIGNWVDYMHGHVTENQDSDPTSMITNTTEIGGSSGSKEIMYSSVVDDALYAGMPNTTLFVALKQLHGIELAWFSEATSSEQLE